MLLLHVLSRSSSSQWSSWSSVRALATVCQLMSTCALVLFCFSMQLPGIGSWQHQQQSQQQQPRQQPVNSAWSLNPCTSRSDEISVTRAHVHAIGACSMLLCQQRQQRLYHNMARAWSGCLGMCCRHWMDTSKVSWL
jgi:hypothetical protein